MQANYQLVLPNIRDYLTDIGAALSMAGVVIGCCDIASIPGTIGGGPLCTPLHHSSTCVCIFPALHVIASHMMCFHITALHVTCCIRRMLDANAVHAVVASC